ncbi:hypothetical protein HDV02_005804 [Globomyces sp. JEL0801]|nr:hypothetical protein HDV02_005804 [Globomyces sp. JEL0801]
MTSTKHILVFPTYGYLKTKSDTKWTLNIKGWAFDSMENSKRRKFLSSVTRRILSPIHGSSQENKEKFSGITFIVNLLERTAPFMSAPLVNQTVRVSIVGIAQPPLPYSEDDDTLDDAEFSKLNQDDLKNGKGYVTKTFTTNASGLFEGSLEISLDEVAKLLPPKEIRTRLRVVYFLPEELDTNYLGIIPLIEPEGISVVSDVDDTIKISQVYDGLLKAAKKVFFGDLADVPGMADSYNLLDFPHRKFLLVGDSGERDIETYERVRLQFPDQVTKVFIRDVECGQDTEQLKTRAINKANGIDATGSKWFGKDKKEEATRDASSVVDLGQKWDLFTDPTVLISDELVKSTMGI